jgi:hypothetical protein
MDWSKRADEAHSRPQWQQNDGDKLMILSIQYLAILTKTLFTV